MDQKDNSLSNNPSKPSKVMALAALAIAFTLPFALVKLFPHKHIELTPHHPIAISSPNPHELIATQKPVELIETIPEAKETQVKAPEPPPVIAKIPAPIQKNEWIIIKTRAKDTLASLFTRAKVNAKYLSAIQKDNPNAGVFNKITPNQEVQFQITDQQLTQVIIPLTVSQYLVIYRNGDQFKTRVKLRKMNTHNHFLTATIQGSLYGTAKKLNIPPKLIKQMTDIFTWDINFAKDVRSGDQFTIVYKAFYVENKLVNTGDILAVSFRNRGKTYQAVRHTNKQGNTDYYTPEGHSLKKAFDRYPVRFSHISSTFSLSRFHPILHYTRVHKGVDLAAPIGTPIKATGDGTIDLIGRMNGYGNVIKIKHNKSFMTVYGHMLKFQKGLSRGSHVKQGQVIGYVGQSGLASGPHCHYEFRISDQAKNPTTVSLPRGNPISSREVALFKNTSRTLLAQLKVFEETHMASNAKKSTRQG